MRENPAPLAEMLIVAGLFFGIVALDATTAIAPRVLWNGYSIRGSVQRLTDEANLSVRFRGYIAGEPVLRAGDEWRIETASLIREHEKQHQSSVEGEFHESAPVQLKFRATPPGVDRFFATLDRSQSETTASLAAVSTRPH